MNVGGALDKLASIVKMVETQWINLVLQLRVMAMSLSRKAWVKKASQVCE